MIDTMTSATAIAAGCFRDGISAYIDGEMTPDDEMRLEMHLHSCGGCMEELNSQKNLLRALDLSLADDRNFELPANFTRTVVATAESRVNGLRRRREWRYAVLIFSGLILITLVFLGNDLSAVISAAAVTFEKSAALIGFAGHVLLSFVRGFVSVSRTLAAQLVFGSNASRGVFVLVFAATFVVFSRLYFRNTRA